MNVGSSRERLLWGRKVKALAAGALLAAMMAAGILAASPSHAATTFSVNSTADTPDAFTTSNTCDTDVFTNGDQCTLRAAIQQANATAGADTINFAISGTGVKTIAVGATGLGTLPTITDPVTINGYTQPGSSPNTKAVGNDAVLKIELSGNGANGTGLTITHVSGSSVVKGLVINRFGEGIDIVGDSVGNRIEGNFIGTDPTGTLDRGNTDDGVNIFDGPSENVIGGTTPAARNVISGNACNAVFVSNATGNRIQGNYVGTDKNGTKGLPNGDGFGCAAVSINESSGNTVGGTTAGARNLISGNGSGGVGIFGDSQNNKVLGNRIGTTANGTGALGNGENGVRITGSNASNNIVGDGTSAGSNTIAFNGDDGVEVDGTAPTRNAISRNSIFSNAGIGIDLQGGFEDAAGNTANDPGDVDTGANGLQNKPLITSAKTSSTKTTISGKLQSRPNSGYTIEFFSNPSANEGKKFLGEKSIVNTDSSGNATFTFSTSTRVPVGQTVTATARSVNLDASNGDTSEFSAPKSVGKASLSALSPETTKLSGPSGTTNSPTAHFKFSSPSPEATFECNLDGGAYYECSSPENINLLSEGRHIFIVRAIDAEGTVDPSPAEWVWAVDRMK
jgi:hypothetical protein